MDRISRALAVIGSCEPAAVEAIAKALEDGRLTPASNPLAIRAVTGARPVLSDLVERMVTLWREAGGIEKVSPISISLAIIAAKHATKERSRQEPRIDMVWSGPRVRQPGLRSTREVVHDILRGTSDHLLVVEYAVTSEQLLRELVAASRRSVRITLIINDDRRNRDFLRQKWPAEVPLPRLLAWNKKRAHRMAKMHIKLVAGDGRSMLVSSANMTNLAMTENMELGVRVEGSAVSRFVGHFDLLEREGVLTEVNIGQG